MTSFKSLSRLQEHKDSEHWDGADIYRSKTEFAASGPGTKRTLDDVTSDPKAKRQRVDESCCLGFDRDSMYFRHRNTVHGDGQFDDAPLCLLSVCDALLQTCRLLARMLPAPTSFLDATTSSATC